MKKIFISAGDHSGDLHAAKLMKAIQLLLPDVQFIGIGGVEMEKAGLRSLISLSEISVVGFWEVAKKYTLFRNLLNKCKAILGEGGVDAFVPVDYPGFNMRLAGYAKTCKIPVLYYIAPQLWAWGANRAKKLAESVDKLLVVFPFEEDYFRQYGIDAKFVGHPLLDIPEYHRNFKTFDERDKNILFLAGSRKQEIHKHLHLLMQTAHIIHQELPKHEIVFAKSKSVDAELFQPELNQHSYIQLSEDTKNLMLNSQAGIIKTGTSNLEAALSGMPFSMYYITSFITYQMGKNFINLDYISLVNILSKQFIVKEFIQQDAKPELIAKDIIDIVRDRNRYADIQSAFAKIKSELGAAGAAETAANEIVKSLK